MPRTCCVAHVSETSRNKLNGGRRRRCANVIYCCNSGSTREESDFYPYRYLASEGFLPGYNFPALPVRAWVPRDEGEFISRPRSLALREFGPNNFVLSRRRAVGDVSFQSPPGGLEERRSQKRFCQVCGNCTATLLSTVVLIAILNSMRATANCSRCSTSQMFGAVAANGSHVMRKNAAAAGSILMWPISLLPTLAARGVCKKRT